MQVFERDIETILHDLKSMDFDIRKQAIADLAISNCDNKLSILNDHYKFEKDIQLKYELRKAINELNSLEDHDHSESMQTSFVNLQKAFSSSDKVTIQKAFDYVLKNRLDEFLPEMMMVENYTRDPYHRTYIIRLMHRSNLNYFAELINYLDDEDSRVVSTAIDALEEIGNTAAMASIVRLTEHSNNRVRASAIKAIHNLGHEKAFELFAKMIQSSYSAYRDSAAYSLSKMNIPQGVTLLSVLLVDEVESIRIKALRGLENMASLHEPEAVDILHRLTNENPYGLWADKLIELMRESKSSEKNTQLSANLLKNPSVMALAALHSDSSKLRIAAIEKITKSKSDDNSAEAIFERLKLEQNPRVIASAVLALGHVSGSKKLVCKTLEGYSNHADERIRANSIEALTNVTLPRERDFLLKSLKDVNNRVKGNAIVALWENSRSCCKVALDELVESTKENHQLTAVYCIGELADWKLAQTCKDLLSSSYLKVSQQMEQTLNHLRDISAVANVLEDWKQARIKQDLQ